MVEDSSTVELSISTSSSKSTSTSTSDSTSSSTSTSTSSSTSSYDKHYDIFNSVQDFVVDFYLSRTETGTRLDVEETFTMAFPNYDSQHGPVRIIPITNQNGKNLTVENKSRIDLNVLMDGTSFPIAKTSVGKNSITYYIGRSSSYLHGSHDFTLKYHFVNVITNDGYISTSTKTKTSSSDTGTYVNIQELYWDANGTGWDQTFNKVTARLHITDTDALASILSSRTSCYVGTYGESGSDRCTIAKTSDGYTFEAEKLDRYEGLTFAVDFPADTYTVPGPVDNYGPLFLASTVSLVLAVITALFVRNLRKTTEKRKFFKGLFAKPEYEPPKDLTVAEGERLLMHGVQKSYVATLLELAVAGKIRIVKGEPTGILKKTTWQVEVLSSDFTLPQYTVLQLLNGGHSVDAGSKISIKRHTATTSTETLARSYGNRAAKMLTDKGLFEEDPNADPNYAILIMVVIFMLVAGGTLLTFINSAFKDMLNESYSHAILGYEAQIFTNAFAIVAALIIIITIYINTKFSRYTKEGLRAEKELEGLKLYIKMAEADRLKFLQSVQGADTSEQGIVKLYEKLLPWAALFGEEKSWLSELNKYYVNLEYAPQWCGSPDLLSAAVFSSVAHSVSSSVASVSTYASGGSGGGSWSSSGGGGGGGGFSGGGGGGGGGGRW